MTIKEEFTHPITITQVKSLLDKLRQQHIAVIISVLVIINSGCIDLISHVEAEVMVMLTSENLMIIIGVFLSIILFDLLLTRRWRNEGEHLKW